LGDGDLQHATGFAFLTGFTGFAMLGRVTQVLAAVFIHVDHHGHAPGFHRARFCRSLNARHSTHGKREADQEDEAKPQITFHGLESSHSNRCLQRQLAEKRICLCKNGFAIAP
jgi:hypothetical protein